jgi:sulfur carrier protein ThiS
MIMVNGNPVLYQDSITITSLLKSLQNDKRFSFMLNFKGNVFCNGELIVENMYGSTTVKDGEEIIIIPLIIGG